jgi:hypothetical protein
MSTGRIIPLKVGDFHRPLSVNDIGRGFKLNVVSGEDCFKKKVFEGDPEMAPMTSSTTVSEIITDISTLNESMEINGMLGVSYGPMISGEGSGSYVQEAVSNRRRAVVVYRTRQNAFFRRFKPGTLSAVKDVDEHREDSGYLTKTYGTKFIDTVVYGAQLDVTFTVTSETDIDMNEIEAELKGKIGIGVLSIEFDAKFNKGTHGEEAQYNMSIKAEATGVLVTIPANPTFTQVTEIIQDFNDAYRKKFDNFSVEKDNPLLKDIEPVGFMLSGTADKIPTLDPMQVARLEDKMEDLEKVFRKTVLWKAKLNAIDSDLKERYERNHRLRTEMYNPYIKIQRDAMADLEDKMDECIAYRAKDLEKLIAQEVPTAYPSTGSPEEDVYRGLCGEYYFPSPVKIEGKSLDDVYYEGFAVKNDDKFVPWMDGTLKNKAGVTIATAETPKDLLANYLSDGSLEGGAIVSFGSVSSGYYLDGRSPGNTGIKVMLTDRNPDEDTFLQWKLISIGDRWAIKSMSSGYYLDGRSPGNTGIKLMLTDRNPIGDTFLQWDIIPYGDTYAIKSVSSGYYLDGRSPGNTGIKVLLTNRNPDGDAFLQWNIRKAN